MYKRTSRHEKLGACFVPRNPRNEIRRKGIEALPDVAVAVCDIWSAYMPPRELLDALQYSSTRVASLPCSVSSPWFSSPYSSKDFKWDMRKYRAMQTQNFWFSPFSSIYLFFISRRNYLTIFSLYIYTHPFHMRQQTFDLKDDAYAYTGKDGGGTDCRVYTAGCFF